MQCPCSLHDDGVNLQHACAVQTFTAQPPIFTGDACSQHASALQNPSAAWLCRSTGADGTNQYYNIC